MLASVSSQSVPAVTALDEGLSEPNSAETEQTSDTEIAAQITHDIKSISQPRVA